jgi:hypothetical protein
MNAESIVVDEVQQDEVVDEQFTEEQEAEAPVEDNAEGEYQVPERFRDKSMQDVLKSYQHLEKKMQEQGDELGQLRPLKRYADELLTRKSEPQVEAEEAVDFFDNPEAAVRREIENSPDIQQMREQNQVQSQQAEIQRLAIAHPDYMSVVQDNSFQEWIGQSPVRINLFQQANNNYNFDAGNELLSNWKERQMITKTEEVKRAEETKRKDGLKAGKGVSKASGESTAGKKIYRTADLIRLKQTEPARYDDLADEIMLAYQEGRVR